MTDSKPLVYPDRAGAPHTGYTQAARSGCVTRSAGVTAAASSK